MNVAAMHSDRPLRDRKPQARATRLTRPRLIDAIETVEDSFGMFGCDPRAVIKDLQANISGGVLIDLHRNRASDGRVFNSVMNNVHKGLPEKHAISFHTYTFVSC